ncbi:hypothetical protein QTP88_018888 [Uroleucon formosanum]
MNSYYYFKNVVTCSDKWLYSVICCFTSNYHVEIVKIENKKNNVLPLPSFSSIDKSDHRYITYELTRGPRVEINIPHVPRGWAVRKLDWTELRTRLTIAPQELTLPDGADLNATADALNDILVDLCDHSMPRRAVLRGRKAVH